MGAANETIKKILTEIPNGYKLYDYPKSRAYIKKSGDLTIRLLIMQNCWDIDVWEGEEYTIEEPKHKLYIMGHRHENFKESCLKAEELVKSLLN